MRKLKAFAIPYVVVGVAYAASGFMVGSGSGRSPIELVGVTAIMVFGWPLALAATYPLPMFCRLSDRACL